MEFFVSLRGALICVILIVGFVSILLNPRIGILYFFLVSILREGFLYEWFPPIYTLHLPQVIIILTSVSLLIHIKEYPLRFDADIALMFLFFLAICSTRFFAQTPVFGHHLTNDYLRTTVVFFLVVQIIRSPRDIFMVLWTFLGLYLFLAVRAYYFYKVDYMEIALPNYNMVDRNVFAGNLAYMLPIAYMLGRGSEKRILRYFGRGAALFFIIGVILTYSRAGLLGVFVGALGLISVEKQRIRIIAVILALTVLILPRLSEKYIGRIETIETYQEDASAMGRVATNRAALEMFKGNPLLGVGAGNFNDAFIEYVASEDLQWVKEGKSLHNAVLQVVAEMGIFGISIFIPLVLSGLRNSLLKVAPDVPERSNLIDLMKILRISLLVSFFIVQFIPGAYYGDFYKILALLAALKHIVREQQYKPVSRSIVNSRADKKAAERYA